MVMTPHLNLIDALLFVCFNLVELLLQLGQLVAAVGVLRLQLSILNLQLVPAAHGLSRHVLNDKIKP